MNKEAHYTVLTIAVLIIIYLVYEYGHTVVAMLAIAAGVG